MLLTSTITDPAAFDGLVALGPATVVGRALETAAAPQLELPGADGNPFTCTGSATPTTP